MRDYLPKYRVIYPLLTLLTMLLLYLEGVGILTSPGINWRTWQTVGTLQVYFLLSFFTVFLTFKAYRNSLITKEILLSSLTSVILYTASLYPVYLLKIVLGRGGVEEAGRFFTREIGLFPSGHTYTALIAFYLLYQGIKMNSKRAIFHQLFIILTFILVILLVVSLFISADHYLSDISTSVLIFLYTIKAVNYINLKLEDFLQTR